MKSKLAHYSTINHPSKLRVLNWIMVGIFTISGTMYYIHGQSIHRPLLCINFVPISFSTSRTFCLIVKLCNLFTSGRDLCFKILNHGSNINGMHVLNCGMTRCCWTNDFFSPADCIWCAHLLYLLETTTIYRVHHIDVSNMVHNGIYVNYQLKNRRDKKLSYYSLRRD
jgi:hypothetical protein